MSRDRLPNNSSTSGRDPAELERLLEERTRQLEERTRLLEERTRLLEQKEQELALARQEADEAKRLKTEFLARMSHDLRTPMNAIVGYARILLRKTREALDDRQYRNLENIQTSAHHLLDLINDILDLSKVEAGRVEVHPEEVDLKRLFYECLAGAASQVREGVELEQKIEGVERLHTDPDRLRRALENLLDNAARHTEQGRIALVAKANGERVRISVEDTGSGIPAENLAQIFDEFRQVARKGRTAEEGTGLGLAIVRRSVELLGGGVSAESCEGKGSTFTIELPLDFPGAT